MAKTVLIADDHPIVRRGLRDLVGQDPRFEIVAEAGDGAEALDAIRRLRPDLAVIDLSMPSVDGFDVLEQAEGLPHPPRFVVLTMHDEHAEAAMARGALGYVLKENAEEELLAALAAAAEGRRFLTDGLPLEATADGLAPADPLEVLTETERRVLRHVARFKGSGEIAKLMSISTRTVQNHRYNATKKLGLSGRNALLHFALDHFA